jgi:hypothetical protein
MNDETAYRAFNRAVQAVIDRLLDSLDEHSGAGDHAIPSDWGATRILLRKVAEELRACPDLDRAVEIMHRDSVTLWVLVFLATEIEDEDYLLLLHSAFHSQPEWPEGLPGQAYAAFLRETAECEAPFRRHGVMRLFPS